MSKPTQAVIDLSKKLWEKGVRKEIKIGDWYWNGGVGGVYLYSNPANTMSIDTLETKVRFIPIWTSCDKCIEWLRGKNFGIECLVSGEIRTDSEAKKFYLVPPRQAAGDEFIKIELEAPTLIEALLKAILEIS